MNRTLIHTFEFILYDLLPLLIYMALLFYVDCYLIQSFISCRIDTHMRQTDR